MKEFGLSRREFLKLMAYSFVFASLFSISACGFPSSDWEILPPPEFDKKRKYSWEGSSTIRKYAQLIGDVPLGECAAGMRSDGLFEATAHYMSFLDVHGKDNKGIGYFSQMITVANNEAANDPNKNKKTYKDQHEGVTDKFYFAFANDINGSTPVEQVVDQTVEFTLLSLENLPQETMVHYVMPFATLQGQWREKNRTDFIELYRRKINTDPRFNRFSNRIDLIDVNNELFNSSGPLPQYFERNGQDDQHLNDSMMRKYVSLIYKRMRR